ncbi:MULTISPECIES: VOC family protein [unclassified Streptomyces]|uniref:VOC family protein n=1 Tax=unclassified Streptomyces TaxID=2593676 RepID=UPI00093B2293|nr:VOC family protein [Streptomyces sp. CB02058]OKI88898.1 glyoxalase [Streptomyces sp. CB02058]
MHIATYSLVALDCPDPPSLAAFYQAVLGGEVKRSSDDWYILQVPEGARIAFQRAEDHRPPEWPRGDRNSQQEHLDFNVTDMDRAHKEVLALGATPLDIDDQGGSRDFRVYADPAGHPFCLCQA